MIKLKDEDFPLSRYRHCYSVGKKMYIYAKEKLGWSEEKCQEMFVLGNLHDIGYELDKDAFGHDSIMANIMGTDYAYSNEIRYHSCLQNTYDSPAMQLLYFGDMTVDGMGNWCTFEERLNDLATRHGVDSDVYKESCMLVNYLTKRGFDDKWLPINMKFLANHKYE